MPSFAVGRAQALLVILHRFFYDRSLAYRQSRTHSLRPRLIGLAHELQREQKLAANSWDIPLDMIATEERIIQV